MSKLLLATNNNAKVQEYKRLLRGLPYDICTLSDLGIQQVVEETGRTMEENATLKAEAYRALSDLLTIADDSGLEVDALGGLPGVLSARFAGEGATDRERIEYLLAKITNIPWEERNARFKCVIAIASPNGEVEQVQGECEGVISFEPRGDNGFGYDPIFYLPDLDKTMAEISMDEKNGISHRGKAVKRARQILEQRASQLG